ncbi:hypothetical protein JHK85_022665 [Glycine max]|nr:hypothetical protein JHK85_022665 [Glycine max]KHN38163.1 hypothetical protein glysoja_007205 [Glycine soja]
MFFFLSLNVCTARPLVVAVEEASNTTQINISRKVSENVKKQPLELNGMTSEGINAKINNMGAEREESSEHTMRKVHPNKALGFVPVKPLAVLVSWHVPHSKHDQNPGFHSDYARPRTRPPSHN